MSTLTLAIDPGPVESAYVVWDGQEVLVLGKQPSDQVLAIVRHMGARPECDLVIEMVACYGMPVGAEVFETCVWVGRFMQAFGPAEECTRITRLTRLEVKMHLCHDSRAKDANIRQAIIDRFGGKEATRKGGALYGVSGDIWAALGVALTYHDRKAGGEQACT